MTDSRLRELERRWQGSGAPGDEAAYLKERVRVGDLDEARVALAARLGSAGAAGACARVLPPADPVMLLAKLEPTEHDPFGAVDSFWDEQRAPTLRKAIDRLPDDLVPASLATETRLRAQVAAIRVLQETDRDAEASAWVRLLETLEAWLAAPAPERLARVEQIHGELRLSQPMGEIT